VRGELLGGDLLRQSQHRIERLPGVIREPRALGQALDLEPLEEQEVEVSAGEQQ
jgi:hypothetical protein